MTRFPQPPCPYYFENSNIRWQDCVFMNCLEFIES